MSFFMWNEDKKLKLILEEKLAYAKIDGDEKEVEELEGLLLSLKKDAYQELVAQDVWHVAENLEEMEGITEEMVYDVTKTFVSQFDYSGYNDYIYELLEERLQEEEN